MNLRFAFKLTLQIECQTLMNLKETGHPHIERYIWQRERNPV